MDQLIIQKKQPLLHEIQRIALVKIDTVLSQLRDPACDRDTAVHDARKTCKFLRAILRLVRDVIGRQVYDALNYQFRDASRLLAASRESAVIILTVDNLMTWSQSLPDTNPINPHLYNSLREAVVNRHLLGNQTASGADPVHDVITVFSHARTQISIWETEQEGFDTIRSGVRRVYRQGRQAMAAAHATPTTQALHEWRKQVKYLWHQIEIITPIWPQKLAAFAEDLHTLSSLLGDDHDLADLQLFVTHSPILFDQREDQAALIVQIETRRQELQKAIWPLGQQLFREKPSTFVQTLAKKWKYQWVIQNSAV